MKNYKTIANLKKNLQIGRIGNHFDFGLCKVEGYTKTNRGIKVEISIRDTNGLDRVLVDSDEIKLKGRIKPDEKEFINDYFTN